MKAVGEVPTRPLLRWFGGKWILSSWIIDHFPPHRIYTESYGGAGSVLLKKPRSYAEIWNDLDDDVVNLFTILRSRESSSELRRRLYLTPFARLEFELAYQKTHDPIEKARRLVVRSYQGFGSTACNPNRKTGFRPGSNRSGTTPAHDWANYPRCLASIIKRLQGVVIEREPALKLLRRHDTEETLHYVDPPYLHQTRAQGHDIRHRYSYELFAHDHLELSKTLKDLKGMVIISGYPSKFYDDLYSGWTTFQRDAMADGALKRVEMLWLNKSAAERLNQSKS